MLINRIGNLDLSACVSMVVCVKGNETTQNDFVAVDFFGTAGRGCCDVPPSHMLSSQEISVPARGSWSLCDRDRLAPAVPRCSSRENWRASKGVD